LGVLYTKIRLQVRYFLLILVLFLSAFCKAQLSAPSATAIRYTSYPSAPSVKDPVFIFCGSSGSQKGTLNATSPGGIAPFSFTWYKWSDVTKSFSILLKTETGVSASSAADLDEGGYRVVIGGGFDATITGWIFIDNPFSSAAIQNFTCDYVALKGQAAVDTFYYRNISNGLPVKLPDGVRFLWSSDPPSTIPYPDFLLNPQTFDPPLVDVTYKLAVSDSFGCKSQSSFFYKSIHVKADFTADPIQGEAPLEVTFTDKSIRASSYKWVFGDSIASAATIKQAYSSVSPNPDPHTYYIPGEYSVKLTVESDLHCIDSLRLDTKIVVDPSELNIPNVFTPDGDGINDNFMIEAKSLRSLNVEVFSRSGKKVYSFYGEGKLISDWKGWDGNVNNSSVKASPGVYFYVMKASGWDNIRYTGKEYRGFVYLYR
jgi:gliding motility-associated-like protein